MEEERRKRGRQQNQKMKPYLTYHTLMRKTDEHHILETLNLESIIEADYGISAERRSLYSDIQQMNRMIVALKYEVDFNEAQRMIDEDGIAPIVYDVSKKGYYVSERFYEFNDVRLLAECVYTAKFISERKAKELIEIVCGLVSEYQEKDIKHDAFVVGRYKTNNETVYRNIATIKQAMSKRLYNEYHKPEKITFLYKKYTIENLSTSTSMRKGERYEVSPYQLIINDGNYYLLAFEDKSQKIKTYRVDKMDAVRLTGVPRDGEDEFKKIDLKNYTNRTFSMYSGKETRIVLRCILPLLDTIVERFGTKGVFYSKVDNRHFDVEVRVDVSKQFFGWLLGFGNQIKLISPNETVAEFTEYIDKIRERY